MPRRKPAGSVPTPMCSIGSTPATRAEYRIVWRQLSGPVTLVGRPGGPAMHPYSVDLRRRVLADCDAGVGTRAVAAKYTVSPSWVRKLKQRRRETGSIDPRTATPGPAPALAPHADRLRELVRA